jgi:hypothetical protein
MAKKCIPGVICIENMTLFIIMLLLLGILVYLYRISNSSSNSSSNSNSSNHPIVSLHQNLGNNNNNDPLTNPYIPTLRNDWLRRSIPIAIATQPFDLEYKQIGILKNSDSDTNDIKKEILPLMGRRKMTSRYKWQYYTIIGGGNGNLQMKLPVKVNGKSCTNEYGCDEISTNDRVYVEGYKDVFVATVYENNTFEYVL